MSSYSPQNQQRGIHVAYALTIICAYNMPIMQWEPNRQRPQDWSRAWRFASISGRLLELP